MVMRSHFLRSFILAVCLLTVYMPSALAQYPGFGDPGSRQTGGDGSGGLVPVVPKTDGGTIPIGATAQVVILFRNGGGQPVETGLIRLYPSSTVTAVVTLNQCEESPLASGAECAIALSVKGLQAGPWRLEMLMSHSGRSRLVTATTFGLVESTGNASDKMTSDIETTPDELNFGALKTSQTLVEPVVLRNITSNPIDVEDVYIDTSDQAGYTLNTDCKKLGPGQACMATVTWSPKLKGRSSGVLVIKHSGPARLSSVPLKGEYTPEDVNEADVFPQAVPGRGLLVSSQTEVDFGGNIDTASTITVSLVNVGDAPLTIQDVLISGSDNGLSFKSNGCASGTVLDPIQACPLTLAWSPTRTGALFDDIQVIHDGARGVLVLPVRGDATATVSQDQKAILLSSGTARVERNTQEGPDIQANQKKAAERNVSMVSSQGSGITNPASALDGYKITSFSPTRAIINGPGGSRLVFDDEEVVLGGVPWSVLIQKNGIEFVNGGHRVLLLFDRSLSSINRVTASSDGNNRSTLSKTSGSGNDG